MATFFLPLFFLVGGLDRVVGLTFWMGRGSNAVLRTQGFSVDVK